MKLYFAPLACSLAAHIVSRELELPLERVEVDTHSQRTADGADYGAVNPLGLVPALVLPSGEVLSENAAVLQYLAALRPEVGLLPSDPLARARAQKWLSFVGTELHKLVYLPLLDHNAPDSAREEALGKAPARLTFVSRALESSDYLLSRFSVADAYLFAVLHWSQVTPITLADYPPLVAYLERVKARPAVASALSEELALYAREQALRRLDPRARTTRELMTAFNQIFLRRDPSGLDALIAEDCVLENTDGTRHEGKVACVALWRSIALDPALRFELEQVRAERDSATITWTLSHGETRIRGVNLMRVRNGQIVEARGYARRAS
jgi:glutathione S-transferase